MSRSDVCTICLQPGHTAAACPVDKRRREQRGASGLVALAATAALAFGAALMLLFAHTADAAELGIQTASWHDRNQPSGELYRTATPGLYLRTSSGWTVGAYSNSIGRLSVHTGYTATVALTERLSAGLYVGAVTGYQRRTTRTEWCSTQPGGSDAQPCRDGLYLNWVTTETGGSKTYIAPLVVPSVAIALTDSVALRINVLPMSHTKGATAVNAAFEVTLP